MTVRLGLVGAGLVGERHAAAIRLAEGVELAAVADPAEVGRRVARRHGVNHHDTTEAMLAAGGLDGVLLATPTPLHAEQARACIAAGLPVLVEKPIAATVAEGREMLAAAAAAGVPIAVGHHRRHNPLISEAKALIEAGALGRLVAVEGSTWLRKPEDYFDVPWRRAAGAGPVLTNLIHDIDLMHHLVGPVASVQAAGSNRIRGFENLDTAVVLLRFESGVLGTVTVSDTIAAPWSWELTARENPSFPTTPEDCYRLGGTDGALALPSLKLWRHEGAPSWSRPIAAVHRAVEAADPLVRQAEQFGAVCRGEAPPLVTGRDGLAALQVVEAVGRAAAAGRAVDISQEGD